MSTVAIVMESTFKQMHERPTVPEGRIKLVCESYELAQQARDNYIDAEILKTGQQRNAYWILETHVITEKETRDRS